MSDPVTNAEIEDVLTSIRRLVSENRPAAASAVPAESLDVSSERLQVEPKQQSGEEAKMVSPVALVLTPALRVGTDAAEEVHNSWADESEAYVGEASAEFDDFEDDDLERWSEDEADGAQDEVVGEVEETAELDASDAAELSNGWDVTADELEAAIAADEYSEDEDAGTDVAEATDHADGTASDQWSDADNAPQNGWLKVSQPDDVETSEDKFDDDEVSADFAEGDVATDPDDVAFDFNEVLEARIVQWRDADVTAPPEEPDAPGDSDYAGTEIASPAWGSTAEDAAAFEAELSSLEQELAGEINADVTAEIENGLSDTLDDAAVIDEAMLREMVADIVRQELQGALGERITRNVRKLVRREIHRALAAHDLD